MEPSSQINSSSLKVSYHPEMPKDVHNQQIEKTSKKWNDIATNLEKKTFLKNLTESSFLYNQEKRTIQPKRSPTEDLQHKQSGKFEESKTGGNNFELSPSTIKPALLEEHQTGSFRIEYEENDKKMNQHPTGLNLNAPSFHLNAENLPPSAFDVQSNENSDQNPHDQNVAQDLEVIQFQAEQDGNIHLDQPAYEFLQVNPLGEQINQQTLPIDPIPVQDLEDIPLNDAENEAEADQQVNNPDGNPQDPSSKRYVKAFVVGTLALSILAIFSHKRYGTISPRGVWKQIRSPQPPIKAKI